MAKLFITAAILFAMPCLQAQNVSLGHLISMASLPQPKFETFIYKKGFYQTGREQKSDTFSVIYQQTKPIPKKNKPIDSTSRDLRRTYCRDQFCIFYQTSSYKEFINLIEEIKAQGFYCNSNNNGDEKVHSLFQHQEFTIQTSLNKKDSTTLYSFKIFKKIFPDPRDLVYADDLISFTSHEYLAFFFGENNLKKDFYFLSGNEMVKCSVLFPNTQRQVVFLWKDEINRTGIANLLFGGQQKLKSTLDDNTNYIAESSWVFKSGIRAGMPLYQLRVLNGDDFEFYGGNSPYTGSVIPNNKGKLDFKKEDIMLGCINCDDKKFYTTTTLNADDAIADGRIVFVLSVMLNPTATPSF